MNNNTNQAFNLGEMIKRGVAELDNAFQIAEKTVKEFSTANASMESVITRQYKLLVERGIEPLTAADAIKQIVARVLDNAMNFKKE